MTMWGCLVNLLRCVLVATTYGSSPIQHTTPLVYKDNSVADPVSYESETYTEDYVLPTETDRPRVRFWYRRVLGVLAFLAWGPVITGTLMAYNYVAAETNQDKAKLVETLR